MIFALLGIIEGKSPYEEMKNEKLSFERDLWGQCNKLHDRLSKKKSYLTLGVWCLSGSPSLKDT